MVLRNMYRRFFSMFKAAKTLQINQRTPWGDLLQQQNSQESDAPREQRIQEVC